MATTRQLINGTASGYVVLPAGEGPSTIYQSDLSTPLDGTLFVFMEPGLTEITFAFYQGNGRMEQRLVIPGLAIWLQPMPYVYTDAIALTVPDVTRITAECTSTSSYASFYWQFQFHYCRCCG